jgi:hypothetical protein
MHLEHADMSELNSTTQAKGAEEYNRTTSGDVTCRNLPAESELGGRLGHFDVYEVDFFERSAQIGVKVLVGPRWDWVCNKFGKYAAAGVTSGEQPMLFCENLKGCHEI